MTFAFNYKVKTRGLILAVYNYGIIAGAREMLGAESLSQVAQLHLDKVDNIEGASLGSLADNCPRTTIVRTIFADNFKKKK
jgi:hypothetical protein